MYSFGFQSFCLRKKNSNNMRIFKYLNSWKKVCLFTFIRIIIHYRWRINVWMITNSNRMWWRTIKVCGRIFIWNRKRVFKPDLIWAFDDPKKLSGCGGNCLTMFEFNFFIRFSASARKLLFIYLEISETRLCDLLYFGQLFKACGNNNFPKITHIYKQFLYRCQNL